VNELWQKAVRVSSPRDSVHILVLDLVRHLMWHPAWNSVRDSVWHLVEHSAWDPVWNPVQSSVWDSAQALVEATSAGNEP
jgi:hypothetical protein